MRDYFAVYLERLNRPPMALADNSTVGAWCRLCAYCAGQENGGRIAGASELPDRFWTHTVGLDSASCLESNAGCWRWDGDDLVIAEYDSEGEELLRKKRAAGRKGAAARWQNDGTANASANGTANAPDPTLPDPPDPTLPDQAEPDPPEPDQSHDAAPPGIEKVVTDLTQQKSSRRVGWDARAWVREGKEEGLSERESMELWGEAQKNDWKDGRGKPIACAGKYQAAIARHRRTAV